MNSGLGSWLEGVIQVLSGDKLEFEEGVSGADILAGLREIVARGQEWRIRWHNIQLVWDSKDLWSVFSGEACREFRQVKGFRWVVWSCLDVSEEFIRENLDWVNWFWVCQNQFVRAEFLIEFEAQLGKVAKGELFKNQKLDRRVLEELPMSFWGITQGVDGIDAELLCKMGACDEGLERFRNYTPDGVKRTWAFLVKHHPNLEDLYWFQQSQRSCKPLFLL